MSRRRRILMFAGAAALSLGLAALAPLLLGTVVLTRFDYWPAALTAGGMAVLLSGRLRLGQDHERSGWRP